MVKFVFQEFHAFCDIFFIRTVEQLVGVDQEILLIKELYFLFFSFKTFKTLRIIVHDVIAV